MKSDHNSANWNCTISPSSKRDHQLQAWSFSSSFDYFSAGRDIPPHFHHKSCLQSQHFLKNPLQDVSSGDPQGLRSQPSSLPSITGLSSLSPWLAELFQSILLVGEIWVSIQLLWRPIFLNVQSEGKHQNNISASATVPPRTQTLIWWLKYFSQPKYFLARVNIYWSVAKIFMRGSR